MPEIELKSRSHAPPDDMSLIAGVARGCEDAVCELYRRHVDAVFGFVYRRVEGCREDTEEIVQDTFLSALKLAGTYRGDSSAFVWLCGLARLRIVDYHRRRVRTKRIPRNPDPSHGSRTDAISQLEATLIAHELLDELTPDEREAMIMRFVEGLSLREISTLLGRTERAIDALLDRAKKKQREKLKQWWGRP